MSSTETLVEEATRDPTLRQRRQAVVALLDGGLWEAALQPEVMACQGYHHEEGFVPDLATIKSMAPLLAGEEERVQRLLEQLGEPCTLDLLQALAGQMGQDLVDLALAHLRTARGERALLLMEVLRRADPCWVK